MLLDVVAQSLKPVKLFSQQLPTFLLFRDRRSVAQQCWIHLHSSSNIVGSHAHSLRMVYKDLWVVSFPQCTAGPNIVGSCCIRLNTTANTHATTRNNVGSCCVRLHAALDRTKSQAKNKGIQKSSFAHINGVASNYFSLKFSFWQHSKQCNNGSNVFYLLANLATRLLIRSH